MRYANDTATADVSMVMSFSPVFGGGQSATPARPMGPQLLKFLFAAGSVLALFLLVPLFLFARPYHDIKQRAAAFTISSGCHDRAIAAVAATQPCTIEWANVTSRRIGSTSSRSSKSYQYFVNVRGGYGDEHTVNLKDTGVFWRAQNGIAVKLQRWGDRVTAVELVSGERSQTAENPDWQLQNDLRGLRVMMMLELVSAGVAVSSAVVLRQLR